MVVSVLGSALFLAPDWCLLTVSARGKGLRNLWSLFYKALIPVMGARPHDLSTS